MLKSLLSHFNWDNAKLTAGYFAGTPIGYLAAFGAADITADFDLENWQVAGINVLSKDAGFLLGSVGAYSLLKYKTLHTQETREDLKNMVYAVGAGVVGSDILQFGVYWGTLETNWIPEKYVPVIYPLPGLVGTSLSIAIGKKTNLIKSSENN